MAISAHRARVAVTSWRAPTCGYLRAIRVCPLLQAAGLNQATLVQQLVVHEVGHAFQMQHGDGGVMDTGPNGLPPILGGGGAQNYSGACLRRILVLNHPGY